MKNYQQAKMESNAEIKDEIFLETLSGYAKVLFKIKGTLAGKYITISISPTKEKNYINPDLANQLVIPESNVIKKLDAWDKKNNMT